MTAKTRQRKVHYRRAQAVDASALDLQDTLARAIKALPDVDHRSDSATFGDSIRVVSGVSDHSGMLVGKLLQYTPGQGVQFLSKDKLTKDFVIDVLDVPKEEDRNKLEFIESITYFAVSKHHFLFVSSMHHGVRAIEDYLRWLFIKAQVFKVGDNVHLVDQATKEALQQISKSPVHKVIVGADIEYETVEQVNTKRKTSRREGEKGYRVVMPKGPALRAIMAMLEGGFSAHEFRQALNKNDRVSAKLELTYKDRAKPSDGFTLMNEIALAGRDMAEDECEVRLKNGAQLKGKDLRVESINTFRTTKGGTLDEHDVWTKLHDQLTSWAQSGAIK